jgi:hypothetical protein
MDNSNDYEPSLKHKDLNQSANYLNDSVIEKKPTSFSISTLLPKSEPQMPDVQTLTLDDINTSLKVIGDLKEGSKLKIVNGKHLAEDNSYANAFSRYKTEQGRDRIIIFLENMYSEVNRNIAILLAEIRNKVNIDNNIYMLQGLIYKISVFLHNYEKMRSVYKSDSHTYSQLGLTRDKYFMFLNGFFRDIMTYTPPV